MHKAEGLCHYLKTELDLEANQKTWESQYLIRFPDCDPFNHLNNSRYLDYFINAREDHLLRYHHFNIYEFAKLTGVSWVVSKNQIIYLKPALLMETVTIQSTLLRMDSSEILVEMSMWNADKTVLKAFLWTRFVHFNLRTQRREVHSAELLQAFESYIMAIPASVDFERRIEQIKSPN